jgi:lysylphosphatidylglycerol synthetase-like protein (DUF2156 family)
MWPHCASPRGACPRFYPAEIGLPIMSYRMAGVVLVYGILLALMSFALGRTEQPISKGFLFTMFGSGALCVVLSIIGLAGYRRRVWSVLVLIVTLVPTLGQVIQSWGISRQASGSILAPSLLTFTLAITIAVLMYLIHGERPAEFYSPGTKRGPDKDRERPRLDSSS